MTERFELLEQVGKGGMGVVWKARNLATGEVVALKLLHAMYADDPDYLERFQREIDVARRIDSPNG
jgi:serine/threonine protein kinase